MNTRRNVGRGRGGAAAGSNKVPPQDIAEGVAMPVNLAGLIDAEVWTALDHMDQAITMQAQAMMAHANRQVVHRDNPPTRSMEDRLQDFTRMNPPIFIEYKILEDPQECIDEVHKILLSMGATDT